MKNRPRPPAAIGLRVKSGWASVVLLSGPVASPRVLDRRILDLSDPAIPASRQPFHAGMGRAQRHVAKLARLVRVVEGYARRSVAALVKDYRAAGHRLRGVGVVVGSDIDPQRITNPHIRAHASEGRLFRTAVETAAGRCGLRCFTVLERNAFRRAAQVLGRSEADLKRTVTAFRRTVRGRWRVEEKTATVAAWLVLASRRS